MSAGFVRIGDHLVVAVSEVVELDCHELDEFIVTVKLRSYADRPCSGGSFRLHGQQALDLVMAIKPSAVEGRRLRFARHAWAFHNLVAHPALQILSWLGRTRLGFLIHDATVPKPRPPR